MGDQSPGCGRAEPPAPGPPLPPRSRGGRGGAPGSVSASGSRSAAEGGRTEGTQGRGLGLAGGPGSWSPGEYSAPLRLAGAGGAGWLGGFDQSAGRLLSSRTRHLGCAGVRPAQPLPGLQLGPGNCPTGPLASWCPSQSPFSSGTCPPGRGDNLGLREGVSAQTRQLPGRAASGGLGVECGSRPRPGGSDVSPSPGREGGRNRGGVDTALDGSWSLPWLGGRGD